MSIEHDDERDDRDLRAAFAAQRRADAAAAPRFERKHPTPHGATSGRAVGWRWAAAVAVGCVVVVVVVALVLTRGGGPPPRSLARLGGLLEGPPAPLFDAPAMSAASAPSASEPFESPSDALLTLYPRLELLP